MKNVNNLGRNEDIISYLAMK